MNLRKLRIALLIYCALDLYIGGHNGGFLPLQLVAGAQTTTLLQQGGLGVSCNAVTTATSTNPGLAGGCTSLALVTSGGTLPGNYTWQVITTGSPTSVTVNFMGSLDGVTWTQIDTNSSATTRSLSNATAYKFLGCVPATLSGGTSPTVTCQVSVTSTAGGTTTPGGGTPLSASPNLIQALSFGVKANTKFITDVTLSTGNANIVCSNNDCNFTTADIGKRCFAKVNSTFGAAELGDAANTTITAINSPQSAQCGSSNATANSTAAASAVWGSDDTAALISAWNASGSLCLGLQLPAGIMLTTKSQFTQVTVPCPAGGLAGATASTGGMEVTGSGQSITLIIPTPDFDYTTCAQATGNHKAIADCFFGPTLLTVHNLQIFGFNVAHNPAGVVILVANEYIMYDVVFGNWCGGCANANGFAQTNQAANAMMGGAQNLGDLSCVNYGNQTFLGPNWACIGTGNHFGMDVASGSAKTINTFFSGVTNSVFVTSGAQWMTDFDEIGGGTASPISNAGTIYMNRFNALNVTANGWWPISNAATGKIFAANSNFNPTSNNWITAATGAQFFDQGGNKYTGGAAGTCGASCLYDSYSINQTTCASGNFAFTSGWGTSAISGTPTGTSQLCQFTINTTVGGSAGPVLTYTFPQSFAGYGKTPNCVLTQVAGTFAVITNPSHVVTTTTDTITFAGTPSVNTYTFVEACR